MPFLAPKWQRAEILEAIFDQVSDALFLFDRDLKIVTVNQAAQKLFGTPAEEMAGKHCREMFRCKECESTCEMILELEEFAASVASRAVNLHGDNGRRRRMIVRTVPLRDKNGALEGALATVKNIAEKDEASERQVIAQSKAMQEVLNFVRRVAVSAANSILIEGENGTGKDLIAKTLHYQSLRQAEPFLAINCAAIPETLLESELFGYEKGAFTDARTPKPGLFELADKGTLFLDEIGEIPLLLQAKLLRVLEDQCFRRLGGLQDIHIDVRIIAATNKNLREAVREGAFRQDLYYRLNVIQLMVPPLRERPQDILPLAHFFIDRYNWKFKRMIEGVAPDAETVLLSHDWPGNVRELRNAIERAMILEESGFISVASLPIAIRTSETAAAVSIGLSTAAPGDGMSLQDHEKRLLVQALEKSGGNQSQAAHLLHITRDTLRYKMKKFSLR